MTIFFGGEQEPEPEPGDVVIGIEIECGTNAPGLDGFWDRIMRISYRKRREYEKRRRDLPNPKPPEPSGGAFPLGGVIPITGAYGIIKDETDTIWIDTKLYGQREPEGGEGPRVLGDDSRDVAGRIATAVNAGVKENKITGGDIIVQHNGLEDSVPPWDDPRDRDKPDPGTQWAKYGGRCRIILRQPSHFDAASDDGKIGITIIVVDPPPTKKRDDKYYSTNINPNLISKFTFADKLYIKPNLPTKMPPERSKGKEWEDVDDPKGEEKVVRVKCGYDNDPGEYSRPILRKDVKWKNPPPPPPIHWELRNKSASEWRGSSGNTAPTLVRIERWVNRESVIAFARLGSDPAGWGDTIRRLFERTGMEARTLSTGEVLVRTVPPGHLLWNRWSGYNMSFVGGSGVVVSVERADWVTSAHVAAREPRSMQTQSRPQANPLPTGVTSSQGSALNNSRAELPAPGEASGAIIEP